MRLDTLTLLTPCCGQEVAIEWGGTVECPECLERWVNEFWWDEPTATATEMISELMKLIPDVPEEQP